MPSPGQIANIISILAPAWGASISCASRGSGSSFQFSPPRGGRPGPRCAFRKNILVFQFSPPRGGRLPRFLMADAIVLFQFSPPRGGRPTPGARTSISPSNFNSRPRVGGVRRRVFPRQGGYNFNSRPRVGGVLCLSGRRRLVCHISILAPAWGASAYLYKCKPLFMCITEEINTISDFL